MGILIIGLGIMLPSWMGRPWQTRHQKGLFFSLLNAGIIATYTVLDGNGVRLSGNAASYTLWLFLFNSWGILSVLIWRRGYAMVTIQLFNGWQRSFLGAFLSMASYGIVLWAMTQASIPSVAALREISVVFAALMGACFFKGTLWEMAICGRHPGWAWRCKHSLELKVFESDYRSLSFYLLPHSWFDSMQGHRSRYIKQHRN